MVKNMIKKYKKVFKESDNLDELVGYLKGKYNTISEVKKCDRFKLLSDTDKEYVLDELKSDMKESKKLKESSILDKGKFIKKEKGYWVLSYPYNFGDLKNALDDQDVSETSAEIMDAIDDKFNVEVYFEWAEKVGNRIEMGFTKF